MIFFRYPGGKSKLKKPIIHSINQIMSGRIIGETRYIEPFFGGGSIGLNVLDAGFKSYWFNDYDIHLAELWKYVFSQTDVFKQLIAEYHPKFEDFETFKGELLSGQSSSVELAFRKLAIHQISYSGLGVKAGGPIGGQSQSSNYKVDCRWNGKNILKKIEALRGYSPVITSLSFSDVIRQADETCFLYIDPPYYDKGTQLYQYGMTHGQHEELRDLLKSTRATWLLSYDDNPVIRDLYADFSASDFMVKYYIANKGAKIRVKPELLITNAGS